MSQSWNIEFYATGDASPVTEFIGSLTPQAQKKIIRKIDLLEQFGTRLGEPHVKRVEGTFFCEACVVWKDTIRIFFVSIERQT